jgi:hypothetical protein
MTQTPAFTPSQPVVQATPPVDERIAAATAAVEAEKAATPAAAPRTVTRTASIRAAEQPVRTADATPVAPVTSPAAAVADPAPAPVTPMAEPATDVAPVATAAPAEATARTDQALLWALGGGALLLLGLGGTAIVRRRRVGEVDDDVRIAPVATYDPAPVAMATGTAPIAPRPAYASASPVVASQRLSDDATLEAMVAAAPSSENPFLTRAKRLRRAQHLIAQRDIAPVAAPAPQTMHAEPTFAPPVDRSQTVYRFGNQARPSGFLKPRTR